MPTREELAWAAGIIDGEGSITPTKSSVQVQVRMCDVQTIWRLNKIIGGRVHEWTRYYREKYPKSKPSRLLLLSGSHAMEAVHSMTPWLSDVKLADFEYAMKKNPNSGKGRYFSKERRLREGR